MRVLCLAFMVLAHLVSPQPIEGNQTNWYMLDEIRLNTIREEVVTWEKSPPSPKKVSQSLETLQAIIDNASDCAVTTARELAQVEEKAGVLQSVEPTSESELMKKQRELEAQKKTLQQRLAICRLMDLSGRELQRKIISWRQKNFTSALLVREDPIWVIVLEVGPLIASGENLWAPKLNQSPPDPHLMLLASIFPLLFLLPMVMALDRRIKRWSASDPELKGHRALAMLGRRLPVIALLSCGSSGLFAGGIETLAAPLAALACALFVTPFLERFLSQEALGVPASLPARSLLTLFFLIQAQSISQIERYLAPSIYLTGRSLVMLLLLLISTRLYWTLSHHPRFSLLRNLRFAFLFCLTFGPVADWLGFRNLASYATMGIFGSFGLFLVSIALFASLEKVTNLMEEMPPGQNALILRTLLGYKPDETVKGLRLGRRIFNFLILGAALFGFLRIWNLTAIQNTTLGNLFFQGFRVGDIQIIPVRIVSAIVIFLLISSATRWLKKQMEEKWFTNSRLDKGERQSIVTLTGYLATAFALLFSLSVAGFALKNLAIIAGALSVGIGFGLQNIVNNFVSGLILLFERPVRPGDWVVVGSTEGYVKRVSIRFTHIETFDRADVLVPNSELVSNQVTNWMLRDPFGRIEVSVGVAYGTDTRLVHKILIKVAEEHPMVFTRSRLVPDPKVLFTSFGDSSLDFRLRCYIRDIDHRLTVRSELLFAIEEAFRKEEIEIPFPQRVIHHAPTP